MHYGSSKESDSKEDDEEEASQKDCRRQEDDGEEDRLRPQDGAQVGREEKVVGRRGQAPRLLFFS
jgi:hypothetical protein